MPVRPTSACSLRPHTEFAASRAPATALRLNGAGSKRMGREIMSRHMPRHAHRRATRALLQGSVLAIGLVAGASASAHGDLNGGDRNGPVVGTVEGPVRGFRKEGVETYLGIPFAAPPVGN